MKALESLSVDEYYQTLSTYIKIIDEKIGAVDKIRNTSSDQSDGGSKNRRKLGG